MADDGQVEVYSPEGKRGVIPASQADDAVKSGYKRADEFIRAIHPQTGKTGLIPKEQWGDAQLEGYQMDPRDQARIQSKKASLIQPGAPDPMTNLPPELQNAKPTGRVGHVAAPEPDAPGTVNALPNVGGALGGALGGMPGAAAGGAIGESARQFLAPAANIPRSETPVSTVVGSGLEQGALEGIGQGTSKVLEYGASKIAPALIKNLIKPSEKMFAYGKDPVEFVMNMNKTFADKAEMAKGIFQELEDTGNQINSKLQEVEKMFPNAPTATKVDIGRAINDPIDKKIAEVSADRGMAASVKKGVIEKLEDLRSGIMTNAGGKAQPTVVKMSTANAIKQQVGKGTDWKPVTDAIESKAQPILNGLRKEIYSNIRQGIENQAEQVGVKGIKELNLKYGSGLDALKSVEKKLNTGPLLSMGDLVTALGSPAGAVLKRAIESTPGSTGAARGLRAAGANAKGAGSTVSQLLRLLAGLAEGGDNSETAKASER
jgi:hypothetical protein